MNIENQETLDEYSIQFFRATGEAGYYYSRGDLTVSDIFLLSLPDKWQLNISTVLLSRTHQHAWTPSEISTFALNFLGEQTPASWYASRNNNDNEGSSKQKPYGRSTTTFNISATSSALDFSIESLPKAKMLGDRNIPNTATKNVVPCCHCGKPWKHSHICDKCRNVERQISAVATSFDIKEENKSHQLKQTIKELCKSKTYPCKAKKTNKSNIMKLIMPLLFIKQ